MTWTAGPRHTVTSPQNIQRRYFTECINRNIALARLFSSSLMMVGDRNMQERYLRGVVNKFPDRMFRAPTDCSYHTSR